MNPTFVFPDRATRMLCINSQACKTQAGTRVPHTLGCCWALPTVNTTQSKTKKTPFHVRQTFSCCHHRTPGMAITTDANAISVLLRISNHVSGHNALQTQNHTENHRKPIPHIRLATHNCHDCVATIQLQVCTMEPRLVLQCRRKALALFTMSRNFRKTQKAP